MSILQSIIEAAPMYQLSSASDCAIWVCDADGIILHCLPAETFNLAATIGSKVSEKGGIAQSLKSGKKVVTNVPKEIYGVPFKSVSAPIFEDGRLIGALAVATSLAAHQTLIDAAHTIGSTAEQIGAATEELAATATTLATNLELLKQSSNHVLSNIDKTDGILRFVREVAASSNLLGLNAAIEAARAGEHGRGFAVVAEEIRKMADHSSSAVKDIQLILNKIQAETKGMETTVRTTAELGDRQAAASQEISASMQELASTALALTKIN